MDIPTFSHFGAILILSLLQPLLCRVHKISITDDTRKNFPLSTFGFNPKGGLVVTIKSMRYTTLEHDKEPIVGFTLQQSSNDQVASYAERKSEACIIGRTDFSTLAAEAFVNMSILFMNLDLKSNKLSISRHSKESEKFKNIVLSSLSISALSSSTCFNNRDWTMSHAHALTGSFDSPTCASSNATELPISSSNNSVSGGFAVDVSCQEQAGLYNLYFHNCGSYPKSEGAKAAISMSLEIVEYNRNNYLSVGDIPLPLIYGFSSAAFFLAGCMWILIIRARSRWVFKVHWLMGLVVFIKSGSGALNAINFHLIGKCGLEVEAWAVLFYIVHVLKGALMFTAILLIGTGYFFVKHVLSSKEKKLFAIVIPLQIFANVAQIIIDETEESSESFKKWNQVMLFVDLVCCGAILLPVIWSIKHLQEAAKTDGKAASSLRKLKLFRQFYVMIVAYIYFTRIVIYLIKITVPYQFMWLDEFFMEAATFWFFFLTGVKFRPADDNPYLNVPVDEPDDEIEMTPISAHSAYGESLTRVNRSQHT